MTLVNHPSLSKIKSRAKTLKKELNILHTAALDEAAKEAGYPSYYALDVYLKKLHKNQSDITNKNIGTDGVNITYAKAQGNRGKLLNPNQQSSLLVVFNDDLEINNYQTVDGRVIVTTETFKEHYLDKGYAEKIGGRLIGEEELKQRRLIAAGSTDNSQYLHEWNYVCIEFLQPKNVPWTVEGANDFLKDKIKINGIRAEFREFFYLDGKLFRNYLSEEMDAKLIKLDDIEYYPENDGW